MTDEQELPTICPFCKGKIIRAGIDKHDFSLCCGRSTELIDHFEIFQGLPAALRELALKADDEIWEKAEPATKDHAKAESDAKFSAILDRLRQDVEKTKNSIAIQ